MKRVILLMSAVIILVVAGIIGFNLFQAPEVASNTTDAAAVPEVNENLNSANSTVFTIDTSSSEARFIIEEVLRNVDTTVVGTTNQISGQVALDSSDPGTAVISEILINARTLVTDNNFRNRALNNRILLTAQYENISFVPTQLVGLPDSVKVGQPYDFQIVGELTILVQTREVTFDTQATLTSDTELTGLATTTLKYADFDVRIPFATAVQAVSEDVTLELEFTAKAP